MIPIDHCPSVNEKTKCPGSHIHPSWLAYNTTCPCRHAFSLRAWTFKLGLQPFPTLLLFVTAVRKVVNTQEAPEKVIPTAAMIVPNALAPVCSHSLCPRKPQCWFLCLASQQRPEPPKIIRQPFLAGVMFPVACPCSGSSWD